MISTAVKPKLKVVADVSVIDEATCDFAYCGKLVSTPNGGYGFVPGADVSPELLYKFMPYSRSHDPVWFRKNGVGPLSDLLPIKGSMVDIKLRHLLNGFGAHHDGRKLEALIKSGSISKHGIRLDCASVQTTRDKAIVEKMKLSAGNFTEMKGSLASILPLIKSGRDIDLMTGNDSYLNLIKKSMGHSNLLIKVEDGGKSKFLKMDASLNNIDELMLEIIANKVAIASGCDAPATEMHKIKSPNGEAVNVLLMDDFSEKNIGGFPLELRKLSIATALGKTDDDIHNMNYAEISAGIENLELLTNNPSELRIEQNKEAIFKWALLNSAMNNTDNHGRNLEILIDDGHPVVAPLFDMKFSHAKEDMSTYIDGDPPIHHIDILNDAEVHVLHDQVGLEGDFESALNIRNNIVNGILTVPSICTELGVQRHEINIIAQAVGIQSLSLGRGLKKSLQIELSRAKNNSRDVESESSVSTSM
ncbi:MAG: HipA domain-containing protein [Colwellia sp.]